MLTALRIKNLALVSDLLLELQPGYNAITGETGAGKSILIGALSLVLGERADRSLLRSGSDSCSVEAVFEITRLEPVLKDFLEQNGLEPCEEHQLVLKRSFTSSGANRQFINGSPTTLSALAAVGEWLVDIHGPHEHQSLLQPGRQLAILDAFGKLEPEREAFVGLVRRRSSLENQKAALALDARTYAQQADLLRFQTEEIAAARLQPDEDSLVERDYNLASNSARLLQLCQMALDLLSEKEGSLLVQAGSLGRTLQELQRVDPAAASLAVAHEQAVSAFDELRAELSRYADKVELDPARLQQLEERLDLLHALKRKYGPTLPDVLAFGEQARLKLQTLEQSETELRRLDAELAAIESEIWRAGKALSAKRQKTIPQLARAVAKELSVLGFKQSQFDIALDSLERAESLASIESAGPMPEHGSREHPALSSPAARVSLSGLDTVEFQFAPNEGEPPRSLRAIASSGELARVMLALKTVLAQEDQVPVLVFDEVDANVGGETANAIGERMRQIARRRQVLCITHLPQVAAPAGAHYVVTKHVKGGRTISEIHLLKQDERVTELARMLGGQSDAARNHAEALLK
jgi:DNA repair protein RecN (Recombination protein N)